MWIGYMREKKKKEILWYSEINILQENILILETVFVHNKNGVLQDRDKPWQRTREEKQNKAWYVQHLLKLLSVVTAMQSTHRVPF